MSRRILAAMVAVTALAIAIFAVPLALAVRQLYRDQTVLRLEREATQAAAGVPASFADGGDQPELPAPRPGSRLALYDSRGARLLGDGPAALDPVLAGALAGRVSEGREGELLVVAVPVSAEERVVGVVRASAAADEDIDRTERAWLAGTELDLRPKEFDLLALLMAEAGRALTRERIMAEVWDAHWFGSTKTLDMHIAALRRHFGERGDEGSRITTLRGVGYRLEPP